RLSRALEGVRTWCSAGVAVLAVLAMLVQPFCAPICGARHCAADTRVGAMHCGGGEQTEDSIAAQRHTCPSPEALPAMPSADGLQLRRAGANNQQGASFLNASLGVHA